jgi:hypothetical protein
MSKFKDYIIIILLVICICCSVAAATKTGVIQGEQGEQGIQGIQGEVGPQGETGTKGDKGDTGLQGPQGIQGLQGEVGPQGEQGIQGEKGETGAQGPQGLKGEQGLKGDKGDTGAQGLQGIQGVKGDKGDTGEAGRGIQRIYLYQTSGNIDTYRILYTDGGYFDFTITNGRDGIMYDNGESEILSSDWVTVYGERYNAKRYITKDITEYRYEYTFQVQGTSDLSGAFIKLEYYIQESALYGQLNQFTPTNYYRNPTKESSYPSINVVKATEISAGVYQISAINNSSTPWDITFESFTVNASSTSEAERIAIAQLQPQLFELIETRIETYHNNTAPYTMELIIK